ncbi:unnamed protein product [Dicrocoelium dendriticum]|nr:unnamed protein product [Dicrocoelium dendriticum]
MNTVTKMIRIFDRDLSGCIEFNEFSELYDYISRWKQCFEAYDADRSGTIDERELMQALNSFGYRLSPTFVRTIIRRFDRSRRGVIGFDDFIYVLVCLQQLTIAFMPYDQAKRGFAMMNFEQFLLAAFATVS